MASLRKIGRPRKIEQAKTWLIRHLRRAPKFADAVIIAGRQEKGFGEGTLRAAKIELGYLSIRPGGTGGWLWSSKKISDETVIKLERLEEQAVKTVSLAEQRTKIKKKPGFTEAQLGQLAATRLGVGNTVEQAAAFVLHMAQGNPTEPPLTQDEVLRIVEQEQQYIQEQQERKKPKRTEPEPSNLVEAVEDKLFFNGEFIARGDLRADHYLVAEKSLTVKIEIEEPNTDGRCEGKTKTGEPCTYAAIISGRYCARHAPLGPILPREVKYRQRIIVEGDLIHDNDELIKLGAMIRKGDLVQRRE
jgi:hypothetical protein